MNMNGHGVSWLRYESSSWMLRNNFCVVFENMVLTSFCATHWNILFWFLMFIFSLSSVIHSQLHVLLAQQQHIQMKNESVFVLDADRHRTPNCSLLLMLLLFLSLLFLFAIVSSFNRTIQERIMKMVVDDCYFWTVKQFQYERRFDLNRRLTNSVNNKRLHLR